MIDTGQYRQ